MEIKIKKLKCLQCNYEWMPRTNDVRRCPKCQSVFWDKEKENK